MSEILASGRFVFRLAGPDDDPVLRQILRSTPLPGWISLNYEREPNYFQGCAVEGQTRTVLAHTTDGTAVGFFSRAVRTAWIDGRPQRLGYLGQLRLLPQWRGRSRAILRGFQVCRQLLDDGQQDTSFYLTSILAGNAVARRLLTAGIDGMPTYQHLCRFLTLIAATGQSLARRQAGSPYSIRVASEADVETMVELLQTGGRRYNLHPFWDSASLRALRPVGWRAQNSLMLCKDDRPVACGTVWDQRCVRQWRVTGYKTVLARSRALANAALGLLGQPRLPAPGQTLKQGFLSHLAVVPGEEGALSLLVAGLLRLARQQGLSSVVLGLSEDHPWLAALGGLRALRYHSDLYLVHWDEGRQAVQALLGRPVQTEVACL